MQTVQGQEERQAELVPNEASQDQSELVQFSLKRVLYSLMLASVMMGLSFAPVSVALPAIREAFQISEELVSWITTAMTLPFMILMPVYGRLSDSLGKRRLILAGVVIFVFGSILAVLAPNLWLLFIGRVIQGIGVAGLLPLGMALISSTFPEAERGRSLGTWSATGPLVAFLSPLGAGLLVDYLGWQAAFILPLVVGAIAFIVIRRNVPAGLSTVRPESLKQFDWIGVLLLAIMSTSFLFYLTSRSVTGVPPFQDFRFLISAIISLLTLIWWERTHPKPFIELDLFSNRRFTLASWAAAMRMFAMAGIALLIPLYLDDVHFLSVTLIGALMMISPGCMIITVRYGGQMADQWGSRYPVFIGLAMQTSVMAAFSQLSATVPLWGVSLLLGWHGLGAGLGLAALHRAVLSSVDDSQSGVAAGLYGMIRFAGVVIGAALGGVILQGNLEADLAPVIAYQTAFLYFTGFAGFGALLALNLRR